MNAAITTLVPLDLTAITSNASATPTTPWAAPMLIYRGATHRKVDMSRPVTGLSGVYRGVPYRIEPRVAIVTAHVERIYRGVKH